MRRTSSNRHLSMLMGLLSCSWMLWRLDGFPPQQHWEALDPFPTQALCEADHRDRLQTLASVRNFTRVHPDRSVTVHLPERLKPLRFQFQCLCADAAFAPETRLPSYPLQFQ